ncbi:MAG TPA: class I tRNA ligase family protein [Jatrophihabitans sp.]|nr:class I tRNA ligase family protein [Jatrophihabitans sp.]
MTRYIVTASPPNPNGDLHLGHLSGPFLGADVQARYLKNQGHDVTHVLYIDEHSCYVPRRARELGADAHETAHVLGSRIEQTLALANMTPDLCGRPHRDGWHDEIVQRYFSRLWDAGKLAVTETDVYYCPVDDCYLYEAEIRGACHHCHAPADGFYCEECGRPQESGRLADGHCTRCGGEPELRSHRRISFPLEDYRQQLTEYFSELPMRPRLREYLDRMFAQPLPDTPISRIGDYGVPVPLADWQGHYLDTWYSGIWGYIAATEGAHRVANRGIGEAAWSQPDTEVHEFLGFDCSFSHAILWPAFALALGLPLPVRFNTNEFYKLEGGKFSTSRGYAIWGGEFLSRVPADSLRYHLCLTGPEIEQTNFAMVDFEKTVAETLVDGLQVIVRAFDDAACTGGADGTLAGLVAALGAEVGEQLAPRAFSPAAAAAAIREFAVTRRAEVLAAVGSASPGARRQALAELALIVEPIMPGWAGDLLAGLDDDRSKLAALALTPGQGGTPLTVDGRRLSVRALDLPEQPAA